MDPDSKRPLKSEWLELEQKLRALSEAIQNNEVELNNFAEQISSMFKSYALAIQASGKSSIRIEATLKALDLKTKKSEIENFIDGQSGINILQ